MQVSDESTDSFLVDVTVPQPAILFITDSYASGWHATPVGDGPQTRYEILPANHALRAIPLAAGAHRIRIEYAPTAVRWGLYAGLLANALFVACWIMYLRCFGGSGRMEGQDSDFSTRARPS